MSTVTLIPTNGAILSSIIAISKDDSKSTNTGISIDNCHSNLNDMENRMGVANTSFENIDPLESKDYYRSSSITVSNDPEAEPETISVKKFIPWGNFKGMLDDRMSRCHHQHRSGVNYNCNYCKNLPIVPSNLKLVRNRDSMMRQIPKRRTFSNLTLQNCSVDENTPLTDLENEFGYTNYTSSFRKKLHYYKELNGFKLKRHLSPDFIVSSSPN